jgi:S1-C subfamily serine protease
MLERGRRFLGQFLPGKPKAQSILVAAAVALLTLSILLVPGQSQPPLLAVSEAPGDIPNGTDLGFAYLPVTPVVARYYGLWVDWGALVTEVEPGGLAAGAGLAPGDVIVSFNGRLLDGDQSLLQMLIACGDGEAIIFEVCAGSGTRPVRLLEARPQ